MSQGQLDKIFEYYIRNSFNSEDIEQDEVSAIANAVKTKVLKEELPQIFAQEISENKRKAEEEVKQYKKKLFQNIKITLIVETIFIAFLVGIIVNQVTQLIPGEHWVAAVIISLGLCILMVILATVEPKE